MALAFAAHPAAAQPAADPAYAEDQSVVVEELEVLGRPPGPAMWRAVQGQSEVIILGSVSPLPHILQWDSGRLERAMDGASVVLVPPQARVGAVDAIAFTLSGGSALKGEALSATLPEALRARFDAAVDRSRQKPQRYASWKPAIAGFMLIGDYREAAGLSASKPVSTIERLARKMRVRVRPISDYKLGPLARSAAKLSDAENRACLEEALDYHEREAVHAQAVGRAWAAGDLRTVKANYSTQGIERCLLQIPKVSTLMEQGVADTTAALVQALSTPGKTVAVVDLGFLLRRNGVLDRLQAQGAAISLPLE